MHGITERYLSGQKADAAGFVRILLGDLESRISMQFSRVCSFTGNTILPNEFRVLDDWDANLIHLTGNLFSSMLMKLAIMLKNLSAMFARWVSYPTFPGEMDPWSLPRPQQKKTHTHTHTQIPVRVQNIQRLIKPSCNSI